MEFLTGRKEKEVLELKSLLSYGKTGQEVKVNGAVMNIRNMGDIAFIILRKRDGVLQTVFEKGVTKAELSQLKEETFVEVTGFVEPEERAPHGVELRLTGVRILSRPEARCRLRYQMEDGGIPGSQAGYETSNAEKCEGARKV